ncbi:MAG: hypothetical protein J2P31_21555 [Blastocatellia bacterium]|nr:hypothetical protein [Blastocatellia bacterium]
MNRSTQNSEELFSRIRRLSDEANWSVDELRDALRAEGIDPDQLVKEIRTKIEELSDISPPQPDHELLPLLPNLRRITGLKATAIAEKLGLPVTFLSDLSSHPQLVPWRARRELAKRASASLPGAGERDVLNSFDYGLYQQAAAYRDAPFPEEEIDFEKMVRRSDMTEEQIQYWLSLADEE